MHSKIPSKSPHRNAWADPSGNGTLQAISADDSANGSANSVWLKRIISRKCRTLDMAVTGK